MKTCTRCRAGNRINMKTQGSSLSLKVLNFQDNFFLQILCLEAASLFNKFLTPRKKGSSIVPTLPNKILQACIFNTPTDADRFWGILLTFNLPGNIALQSRAHLISNTSYRRQCCVISCQLVLTTIDANKGFQGRAKLSLCCMWCLHWHFYYVYFDIPKKEHN